MALGDIKANTTSYKATSGDTFSEIAQRCIQVNMPGYEGLKLYNDGINKLKSFNPDIVNINYISIGQTIILQGTPKKKTVNVKQQVTITNIGVLTGVDQNQVFVTWTWKDHSKTDHYEVEWKYNTVENFKGGVSGETATTKDQLHLWTSIPENAECVSVRVKPVSKTYKSGDKDLTYFTGQWSTWWTEDSTYHFSDNPPLIPDISKATITISSKHLLKIKMTDLGVNAKTIQFEIEKDGTSYKKANKDIKTTNDTVEYSTTVPPSADYRVRCRSYRDGMYSHWSDWSDYVPANPAVSAGIYSISAIREMTNEENQFVVRIQWFTVDKADNYIIQYTTKESYFESNPNEVTSVDMQGNSDKPVTVDYTEISRLEGGKTYFFRVAAVTKTKQGDWSEIEGIILGEKPTAPTTWSSTTSAITGEPLNLYWVHNSIDNSSQTSAVLELTTTGMINGKYVDETKEYTIESSTLPEDRDKASVYEIDTAQYAEGVKIKWRVKTAGIMINADTGEPEYGDWSVLREIVVYAHPTLDLNATNYLGEPFTELTAFPIRISASAGPTSQKPISYHLSIIAGETYDAVDDVGNVKMVSSGSAVYSKYFDTDITDKPLEVTLSAGDLNLSNNIEYTIVCTVSMDSGLTTEERITFTVTWDEIDEIWPNAEIIYDANTYTVAIKPYAKKTEYEYDLDGNFNIISESLIDGVTLSVYRRNFDGTFTELFEPVSNTDEIFITDPHPSLDYARYRIVAVSDATGAVSYYDVPGYPIEEKAAIIQWDEEWTNFNVDDENALNERYWSGSLLRLPYNIDVADQHDKEVELINYVGRKYPVSYYGTQVGHTATWNMEIEKDDEETLYALRRLARWMGDVYVREPSGSSYWATIKVSFSQTHCELTIPVSLEITRVEGDI